MVTSCYSILTTRNIVPRRNKEIPKYFHSSVCQWCPQLCGQTERGGQVSVCQWCPQGVESDQEDDQQGWLSPRTKTSRTRPLEFSLQVTSSFYSSVEEDERSSEYSDHSVTLVPDSCSSASPGDDSLPSSIPLSVSSSIYATPIPSPMLSPQSSFYSCRSSLHLSPNEPGKLFCRKLHTSNNFSFKRDYHEFGFCTWGVKWSTVYWEYKLLFKVQKPLQ